MTEINTQNLNSYYATNAKVHLPEKTVVSGPSTLPRVNIYNDQEANKKIREINKDVYESYKKEEKKEAKNFIKIASVALIGILSFLGFKKVFSKVLKKS